MQFHTGEEGQGGMFGNKQKATGSSMFENTKIASGVLFDCISS